MGEGDPSLQEINNKIVFEAMYRTPLNYAEREYSYNLKEMSYLVTNNWVKFVQLTLFTFV